MSQWRSYEIISGMPESTMVWVEGGSFMMGSEEGDSDEEPIHEVSVGSFYIAQYPTSKIFWELTMGKSLHRVGKYGLPIEQISWEECQDFLEELNDKLELEDPYSYRLPTEAEWEYAARGGKYAKGARYAGSNVLEEVGWFGKTEGEYSYGDCQMPGFRIPNELGLYDMSGNVYEWCYDWYGDYSEGHLEDTIGPDIGYTRILRGGSWIAITNHCRVAYRNGGTPDAYDYGFGLRLAKTVLEIDSFHLVRNV